MTREGGEESRFVDLTPPCIRDRRIDFTRDNEISIDIFPFVRRFFSSSSFFQTAITFFKLLKIRIIRTINFFGRYSITFCIIWSNVSQIWEYSLTVKKIFLEINISISFKSTYVSSFPYLLNYKQLKFCIK